MPTITNRSGLPDALVKAIENDSYTKGDSDYSTTELSVPSRIVALKIKHWDELEEDAGGRIYSLIGRLGHSILEHSGTAEIIERRLFCQVGERVISGQVDVIDGSVLSDWKFCSYHTAKEGVKPEWQQQASVNAYICHRNGIKIERAEYVAIFRDFSKPASLRDSSYPKSQVQVFNIPLWSLEQTEEWIKSRIQSHEDALQALPECTPQERWQKPGKVAVMVNGKKRAVKLLDTQKWADEYILTEQLKGAYIEDRPAESIRCMHYCPVSKHCSWWQDQIMLTQQGKSLE